MNDDIFINSEGYLVTGDPQHGQSTHILNVNKELKRLKRLIGGWAYRALLRGKPLECWRNSTPHNYWIDGSKDFLWHSDEYDYEIPNLRLFDAAYESGEKVIQYWGSDSGMPRSSHYVLKDVIINYALKNKIR
jgi:hypothetical protein